MIEFTANGIYMLVFDMDGATLESRISAVHEVDVLVADYPSIFKKTNECDLIADYNSCVIARSLLGGTHSTIRRMYGQ